MTFFVGLDVSQKMTAVCVVDDAGRRLWRGQSRLPCMGLIHRLRLRPSPGASTMPTTACPPVWTCTCSTVIFCMPAIERVEQHREGARELASLVQIIPEEPGVLLAAQLPPCSVWHSRPMTPITSLATKKLSASPSRW